VLENVRSKFREGRDLKDQEEILRRLQEGKEELNALKLLADGTVEAQVGS
jgi:hypothetical protein